VRQHFTAGSATSSQTKQFVWDERLDELVAYRRFGVRAAGSDAGTCSGRGRDHAARASWRRSRRVTHERIWTELADGLDAFDGFGTAVAARIPSR
jgi:hypothetical protein